MRCPLPIDVIYIDKLPIAIKILEGMKASLPLYVPTRPRIETFAIKTEVVTGATESLAIDIVKDKAHIVIRNNPNNNAMDIETETIVKIPLLENTVQHFDIDIDIGEIDIETIPRRQHGLPIRIHSTPMTNPDTTGHIGNCENRASSSVTLQVTVPQLAVVIEAWNIALKEEPLSSLLTNVMSQNSKEQTEYRGNRWFGKWKIILDWERSDNIDG